MSKMPVIVLCCLLIVALAAPVFANGTKAKTGALAAVPGKVYRGTGRYLAETESHMTEILRNTFGLFNPCLDLVKGCTSLVMYPIEAPFDWMARRSAPTKAIKVKGAQEVPVPKKPEIPKR